MNGAERRERIMARLHSAQQPVSASQLSRELGVSRQSIVGDIAILRAVGEKITATARGYLCESEDAQPVYEVTCNHGAEDLRDELYTFVDCGARVLDVTVRHSVYGILSGPLNLASRYDVDRYLEEARRTHAKPILTLTDGVHRHRIACADETAYARLCELLSAKGYLLENPE